MNNNQRKDLTTIQVPRDIRERLKKKKRGDETYAGFFTRVFKL